MRGVEDEEERKIVEGIRERERCYERMRDEGRQESGGCFWRFQLRHAYMYVSVYMHERTYVRTYV